MTGKILIVEDDQRTRECLGKFLRLYGFETLACTSGEEAISVTLGDPPDVILMDLGLPGMSGIEAAQVMKQEATISRIPIIALSGRPAHLWERTAREAGINLYLTKPASAPQIVEAICKVLPS
jgi:CheY-like chemotaxis protein